MPVLQRALFPAAFLVCVASTLLAQSTATVVGTVRDSSGAVIANVAVTATNKNTDLKRTVQTTSTGSYEMTALPIGTYTVSAELTGFKQSEVANVILQVAQEARVDVNLVPGDVNSMVSVSTEPSLIQTDSASLGQVIDNQKIVDLPLNGRNFVQLTALTPGALTSTIPGGPPSGEVTGATTVSVSGGQSAKTEFLLDGISDQEQLFDGVQFSPSVDFIQDFRVQSNAFSAEYGRGSAIVNVSTKSGTNAVHGTAFEFLRNNDLDARNFFAPTTQVLKRNQFGGSVGGPVRKNRLFYFFNYEGTRLTSPNTVNVVVPTNAQRSGMFTSTVTNPLTGQPFANNTIPAGSIDPIAQYFLKYVPGPNGPNGQYLSQTSTTNDADQGNVRIDYTLSQKDNLFARYSMNDFRASNPGTFPTSGGTNQTINTKNAVISYTHVFSPTVVNEARVGYGRLYSARSAQGVGTNYTVQSGILGFDQTTANFPGFPDISVGGYSQFLTGGDFDPIINPTNTYEFTDIVTWQKGRHAIRAGIDVRHLHLTSTNGAWSRGSFSYNGQFSGNALADFLLGYPSSGIRDYPRNQFGLTNFDYPLFIQDDIKATSKLTVNLGLRYDLSSVPKQDLGQNSYFDQSLGKWVVSTYHNGQINLTTQQVAQSAYNEFASDIITAKQAGLPNNLQTISKKNFAPRVGFAYRPFSNDRTVIRSGYGIYYLLQRGNPTVSNAIVNIPFIQDQFTSNFASASGAPAYTTKTIFATPFSSGGADLSAFDLHIRPPYNQEWNFTVQQELVRNLSLQLAYVGNKGSRLDTNLYFNVPTPGPGNPQANRPLPQFGQGGLYTNEGSSTYHAFQATLEKRYSAGLTLLSTFTWSKLIDNGNVSSNSFSVQDPFNLSLDRGPGASDVPFRSVSSFSYELPYGKGRRFGASAPRVVDLVAGGWQVAGIASFQSGFPFSPTQSSDPSNTGNGGFDYRPNLIGNPSPAHQSIQEWFNPSAFQVPALYTFGDAGRNILRGPGFNNWDLSLLKNFHFTESKYLQLRGEFFNTSNHPHFNNPDSNIQSPTAGQILSAGDPREIQVAAKIYF